MSKFVKLTTSAYVNGVLRHPHEGGLHLEDDEAKRLIDNGAAVDVTADFSADDRKDIPCEGIRASDNDALAAAKLAPVEHQANVPLSEADEPKDGAAKPAKPAKPAT